ncbi:MAG: phosphoribosylanthranilate isomerase, partial [Firmicutes bacterium]|nr:phosphoribosylanthranilate isomerase [Bacillota bacterium]
PTPELATGRPRFLLLDTYRPGFFGGTGRSFPWAEAAPYRALGIPILIAGGLNPGNVRTALELARPAGVDVSSGIESAPGKKDPALIAAFINAVRDWERTQLHHLNEKTWR